MPHVNKKPLERKQTFVDTPFSHPSKKLEQKKTYAAKPLAFSLGFLFQRNQKHYSNLTPKIMKMFDQIFKTAPQYNNLKCKKAEHLMNSS